MHKAYKETKEIGAGESTYASRERLDDILFGKDVLANCTEGVFDDKLELLRDKQIVIIICEYFDHHYCRY